VEGVIFFVYELFEAAKQGSVGGDIVCIELLPVKPGEIEKEYLQVALQDTFFPVSFREKELFGEGQQGAAYGGVTFFKMHLEREGKEQVGTMTDGGPVDLPDIEKVIAVSAGLCQGVLGNTLFLSKLVQSGSN